MSFLKTAGRVAAGWGTGGLSEVYRAMRPGGGMQGYGALPFDYGANIEVNNSKIAAEIRAATGRDATPTEIESYARYIKTGDLDYGDIGQIIQGSPELSKARIEDYTNQFGARLGANDQAIIDKSAATANSTFAGLGRQNSSALAASVMQAGGALAQQRQSALAQFYGQNLQNNMSQYVDRANTVQGRAYQKEDNRAAFNRSLLGYQTQRNDFNTDLNNQESRNRQRAYSQLPFTLGGAAIGGALGGGAGAGAGAQVGSQFGGLFGRY
jgi:hypothetical protein